MRCSTTGAFGLMVALWFLSPPALSSQPFHFEYQVSPLLAKVGCSSAECHGAASGKGGFKLSLFAENPRQDYETITRELDGRRLDYQDPGNSLFLKKPSRQGVKHGGGRLLRPDDQAYQDLLTWIARGGEYSEGQREDLVGLTLSASAAKVTVHARFQMETGETVRDVTGLALLESNDEQVVTVGADGKIARTGSGEAWILARYGKFSARLPLRQRFAESSPDAPTEFSHPLDRVWGECLSRLGLRPGPSAPAETLLRRIYMDLAGRPPDLYELLKCREISPEQMLPETVDRLLQSADFDRVFAGHLAEFYEVPPPGLDAKNARSKNDRLRALFLSAVKEKASLATLSRRVLSDADHQIAWKSYGDPRDRAEYIGRTMLGIRIGCARCHNHPLDRWTNSEHLSFAAYFSDPRPTASGGMMAGKLFRPDAGREVEPKLLPLVETTAPAGLSREKEIAWFILEAGRRQFARNMANRIFGKLMGKPLVDLPDDHRLTNPARHEPILDLLTEVFLEMDTQLRPFVKFIVTYADPSHGHMGTICQATCWAGLPDPMPLYDIGDGKPRHSRSLAHAYVTHSVLYFRDYGIDVNVIGQGSKHRYVYFLNLAWLGEGPARRAGPRQAGAQRWVCLDVVGWRPAGGRRGPPAGCRTVAGHYGRHE